MRGARISAGDPSACVTNGLGMPTIARPSRAAARQAASCFSLDGLPGLGQQGLGQLHRPALPRRARRLLVGDVAAAVHALEHLGGHGPRRPAARARRPSPAAPCEGTRARSADGRHAGAFIRLRYHARDAARCAARRTARRRPSPSSAPWLRMPARALSGVADRTGGRGDAPAPSPRRCSKASTSTMRCSATARARRSGISRTATSSRSRHLARERIDFYDRRVAETAERIEREFTGADGHRRRRAVGARQAALHRPADRAPAAGVRRDVLQLGVVQDPAPHVLPQPLHLRAAGGLHRVPRRRPADLPQLLPASPRAARRADRHRARLRAQAPLRRLPPRPAQPARARSARRYPRPFEAAQSLQIQVLVIAVLPQPHRVHRRPRHQRPARAALRRPAAARRGGPPARRRAAHRRDRARAAVLRQPRLLPRRHGGAFGVRRLPAARACRTRRRPSSTRWSACRSTARTSSTATSCTTCAHSTRPLHRRARHQGARDERVHAALVSVRVQGDQGPHRRLARTRTGGACRRSTRWSSTTTASGA